jgi:hypothetical protein
MTSRPLLGGPALGVPKARALETVKKDEAE